MRAARPHLDLVYASAPGGRTQLVRRYCRYPYSLTGTFAARIDSVGPLSVIPQSAAGGLFEGDDVHERHRVGANASVRVLDQGSVVVHGTRSGRASGWHRDIEVGANASASWLNSPLVMLPGARLVLRTTLEVDEAATVVLVDGVGVHTPTAPPAAGGVGNDAPVTCLSQALEVRRAKAAAPIAIEHYAVELRADEVRWFGTVLMLLPAADAPTRACLVDNLWHEIESDETVFGGVSELPNQAGLAVRLIASSGGKLKQLSAKLCARVSTLR